MIIECADCGRKYSSRQPTCPGCGIDTPDEFRDVPTGDAGAGLADPGTSPSAFDGPLALDSGTAEPPTGGGLGAPAAGPTPGAPTQGPPGSLGQDAALSAQSLLAKQRAIAEARKAKRTVPVKAIAAVVVVIAAIFIGNAVKNFFTPEEAKIAVGNPSGAEPGSVDLAKMMMAPYGFVDKRIRLEGHFMDIGSTRKGYTTITAFAPATGTFDFFVADKYVGDFQKLEEGDRFAAYGYLAATVNSVVFRVD